MTILRMYNENGRSSEIGWGKYHGKNVEWIYENDPDYLLWVYFNLKAVHMKQDICSLLGDDAGIAFHKRKLIEMLAVEISNWKTFVAQFGLNDTYMGCKSARQIHIQMRKEIESKQNWTGSPGEPPEDYAIRCNTDSEAICIFKRVYYNQTKQIVRYEYRGTAN